MALAHPSPSLGGSEVRNTLSFTCLLLLLSLACTVSMLYIVRLLRARGIQLSLAHRRASEVRHKFSFTFPRRVSQPSSCRRPTMTRGDLTINLGYPPNARLTSFLSYISIPRSECISIILFCGRNNCILGSNPLGLLH